MVGYLSPTGNFFKCEPWGHTELASRLVFEVFGENLLGLDAEDFLLDEGFLAIKTRDAFFRWHRGGMLRIPSEPQLRFLRQTRNSFNESVRKEIDEILEEAESPLRLHLVGKVKHV